MKLYIILINVVRLYYWAETPFYRPLCSQNPAKPQGTEKASITVYEISVYDRLYIITLLIVSTVLKHLKIC